MVDIRKGAGRTLYSQPHVSLGCGGTNTSPDTAVGDFCGHRRVVHHFASNIGDIAFILIIARIG